MFWTLLIYPFGSHIWNPTQTFSRRFFITPSDWGTFWPTWDFRDFSTKSTQKRQKFILGNGELFSTQYFGDISESASGQIGDSFSNRLTRDVLLGKWIGNALISRCKHHFPKIASWGIPNCTTNKILKITRPERNEAPGSSRFLTQSWVFYFKWPFQGWSLSDLHLGYQKVTDGRSWWMSFACYCMWQQVQFPDIPAFSLYFVDVNYSNIHFFSATSTNQKTFQ